MITLLVITLISATITTVIVVAALEPNHKNEVFKG